MKDKDWVFELFAVIDRQDADAFADYLREDVKFRFGNTASTRGRLAVRDAVAGFLRSIASVRHEISNTWHSADHVICRGRVTYTRQDGSLLTVPFANIFKVKEGKIADYDIYVDISQLYA